MKHISKQSEPSEFATWKALANEDWQPSYDDLAGCEKKAVKNSLISEQGSICCYCERRLSYDDSHIEHFKPQATFPAEALDYDNMVASCQNRIALGEPRHCGNLKGNWYDQYLTISPLDPVCEDRFAYSHDGRIGPAADGDQGAVETITHMGLGIPKLNALRKATIEPFLDEELTPAELEKFVAGYLQTNADGSFNEFFTSIHQLFGN